MRRRDALFYITEGVLVFFASGGKSLFAAEPPKLFIEGWKIAADESVAKKGGLFGLLAQHVTFEHLYLKLRDGKKWVYFAGFPTDPTTGKLTSMWQANACLGVHVLSEEENEALRNRYAYQGLQSERSLYPAKPVTEGRVDGKPLSTVAAVDIAGTLLDLSAAINSAGLRYVPAQINASPPNSNAVAAALLAQVGYCAKDSCERLQGDFSAALAPGINHGLSLEVKPGHVYADLAKQKGATVESLVRAFKASDEAQPRRPVGAARKDMVSSDPETCQISG